MRRCWIALSSCDRAGGVVFAFLMAAHAAAEAQTPPKQAKYSEMVRSVTAEYAEPVMALSRDGRWLSYSSADGGVRLVRTDQESAEVAVPLEQGARCKELTWNSNGANLALSCAANGIGQLLAWKRGGRAVVVVSDSLAAGIVPQWIDANRLMFATERRPLFLRTPPPAPASRESKATLPTRCDYIGSPPFSEVAVCSDSVDVLRSTVRAKSLASLAVASARS